MPQAGDVAVSVWLRGAELTSELSELQSSE